VFICIIGGQFVGQSIYGLFVLGPTEGASHFLSGGSFGPEGSLATSVIWGIAAFLAYRYFQAGHSSSLKARPERTPTR
jgi:hypothetical protein